MQLLCVAHEKEILGFQDFADTSLKICVVGVGQFTALATLSRVLATEKFNSVILAGSCGSINAEDQMQLFRVEHFAFPKRNDEEVPEFLDTVFATTPAIKSGKLSAGTVLQNYGISLNAEKFIADAGYIPPEFPKPILENMEAASLAWLCRRNEIPFTALLCVTNAIGLDARRDWQKNFRSAGELVSDRLKELLFL